jgi:hypothetical protein
MDKCPSRSSIVWFTVLPLTAVFHSALFYPHQCMLNPFGKESLSAWYAWFSTDPSLICAIAAAALTWAWVPKCIGIAFLIAFLPLTLWIWDIPGSGRVICQHFHDGRLVVSPWGPIRTLHFYVLGLVMMISQLIIFETARRRLSREPNPASMESMPLT